MPGDVCADVHALRAVAARCCRYESKVMASTEFSRTLLAGVITLMDLVIVVQDWEFPRFDSPFLEG